MNKSIWWIIGILVILAGAAYYVGTSRVSVNQQNSAPMQPVAQQPAQQGATSASAQNSQVMSELVGNWVSTQDSKFTRDFSANGTVTDAYQGQPSATMTGPYSIVDPAKESNFPVPLSAVAGKTVVRIDFAKMSPMYFSIIKLDATSLEMSDLSGRGNTLSFTKAK